MSRVRYPLFFILAVVVLTGSTLLAYGRIGAVAASRASASLAPWPGDSTVETPSLSVPTRADYERYSESDSVWREQNARQYTIAELRARGDGRRTERWVSRHPRDKGALLS